MTLKKDLQKFYTVHVGKNTHCIHLDKQPRVYVCDRDTLFDMIFNHYGHSHAQNMMYEESFFAEHEKVAEVAHASWILTVAGSMLKLK